MRRNQYVIRLAISSLFVALYFVLSYFATIKIGNIRLSFTGIIVIYASLLLYFKDTVFILVTGEFLLQLSSEYGLTPTTILWMLPPVLKGIIISTAIIILKKHNFTLIGPKPKNYIVYFIICIFANLVTTAGNTGVIYLDAYIFNYPASYARFETLYRFITSFVSSLICASLTIPLYLRTKNFTNSIYKPKIDKI